MDYLRSGYTVPVRWRSDSDETITIRWQRAAPGAKVFLEPHAFGSTVWDDDDWPENEGPGEVPHSRTWSASTVPVYPGTAPAVTPATLLHGVPSPECDGTNCFHAQLALACDYGDSVCLETEAEEHIVLEDGTGCIRWI